MIVERDYAPETGRLGYLCAGTVGSNGCAIFDAGYNWDKAGNLITQTFSTGSRYAESYSYDGLNRLKKATLLMQGGVTQNTVTQGFKYDALNLLPLCSQRIDLKLRVALGQHMRDPCPQGFRQRRPEAVAHHEGRVGAVVRQNRRPTTCGRRVPAWKRQDPDHPNRLTHAAGQELRQPFGLIARLLDRLPFPDAFGVGQGFPVVQDFRRLLPLLRRLLPGLGFDCEYDAAPDDDVIDIELPGREVMKDQRALRLQSRQALPDGEFGLQCLEVAPACAGVVDQSPGAPEENHQPDHGEEVIPDAELQLRPVDIAHARQQPCGKDDRPDADGQPCGFVVAILMLRYLPAQFLAGEVQHLVRNWRTSPITQPPESLAEQYSEEKQRGPEDCTQ